jgi:predicted transcriptional regulator
MRNEMDISPTEREMEILKILWEMGEASVRQVFDVMRAREDIAQNTVQTFLRIMADKGLVSHKVDGRTFIYKPNYSREKSVSRFIDRVFDGAVNELVMNALNVKKLSTEELDSLEKMIADAKRKNGSK